MINKNKISVGIGLVFLATCVSAGAVALKNQSEKVNEKKAIEENLNDNVDYLGEDVIIANNETSSIQTDMTETMPDELVINNEEENSYEFVYREEYKHDDGTDAICIPKGYTLYRLDKEQVELPYIEKDGYLIYSLPSTTLLYDPTNCFGIRDDLYSIMLKSEEIKEKIKNNDIDNEEIFKLEERNTSNNIIGLYLPNELEMYSLNRDEILLSAEETEKGIIFYDPSGNPLTGYYGVKHELAEELFLSDNLLARMRGVLEYEQSRNR